MKYNIKIGLPIYKIIYSLLFILILSLIRGISSVEEIGPVLDTYLALLAIIVCSDTYYQEIQGDRWEVFYLLPRKKQFGTILQRFIIQIIFLVLLIVIGYSSFLIIQKPRDFIQDIDTISLFNSTVFACMASLIFFGSLSFTIVNIIRNLWAGIVFTFLIWNICCSTLGQKLPYFLNIFSFGSTDEFPFTRANDWMFGKLTALTIALILLLLNKYIITRQRKV